MKSERWTTSRFAYAVATAGVFILVCTSGQAATLQDKTPEPATFRIETIRELHVPGGAVAVAWSPDGNTLVAAGAYGTSATVWDGTGQVLNQFKVPTNGPVLYGSIAFASGSSQVLFRAPDENGSNATLGIWDTLSGRLVGSIAGAGTDSRLARNQAAYFRISTDQQILTTASAVGGVVNLYSANGWNLLHSIHVEGGVHCLDIFDQGKLIAVGGGIGRVSIYDSASGAVFKEITTYERSSFGSVPIGAVAGNPEGDSIFVGAGLVMLDGSSLSSPETNAAAKAWATELDPARLVRLSDGSKIASIKDAKAPIRSAEWELRGRYLAFVDSSSSLIVWDARYPDRYTKTYLPGASLSLAISPNGEKIAVATTIGITLYSVK